MALYGISGFIANFVFTSIRIVADQILENLAGVGELLWTWPQSEQVVDVINKWVYAIVMERLADLWI